MTSKYKYLMFDLDNTLVDDNKNRKYAISRVLDYLKLDYDEATLEAFIKSDNEYWKKMANKEFDNIRPKGMNAKETFTWAGGNRIRYFLRDYNFSTCVRLNEMYMEFMKEKIFPIDGVKEVLKQLKEEEYLLYIITNGPEQAAYKKKEAVGDEFFKDMIASEKVGYMKPHKEFYDAMYSKFDLYDKDEMLIIGDELDKDILGGNRENIDTVWVNLFSKENNTDIKPTYEINSIKELKKCCNERNTG